MESEKEQGEGVNLLPIPPPLEFPYPESSQTPTVDSTSQPKAGPAGRRNASADAVPKINITGPTTPGLLEHVGSPKSRPTAPRRSIVTELPPPRQRAPPAGMRRHQTGAPPNAFSSTMWDSDSESPSSSDDEPPVNNGLGKTKSLPLAGLGMKVSKRRQSEDPYRKFSIGNEGYKTRGHVSKKDGRLNISVNETSNKGYLAKTLEATLRHHLKGSAGDDGRTLSPLREEEPSLQRPAFAHAGTTSTLKSVAQLPYEPTQIPKLSIVIMVIGSRGDIQPFLRLGKILKEKHNHRVRIATHPVFKEFVEKDSQLEFFSVGGDPAELMAFMVKNPGLIPTAKTIRAGEIGRRREAMYEMFQGFWRACINATDDEHDIENLKMMGDKHPFIADAIIANPPSFAHIHCAERLGIPLHLMFTFPTSPTQQFPHPLTNIKQSNMDANYTNFLSYPLVEMMTWQGLGDLVNRFRVKSLGLEPLSTLWAPGQIFRQRVPHSYLWSPGLIPKPGDWGPEIDVTGFVFLDLASSFKPSQELADFLKAGEPPVYIGFGSIVVDDPDKFTAMIFEAVKVAGVRALVSQGWGGLGGHIDVPENIFLLGNTPHDWLFPQVSAVVHHGGAGSTAIGLKCGRPTMIVPFFGDQPFWGAMVAKAGAGPEPVPYKHLSVEVFADSIQFLLTPEARRAAEEIARRIEDEGDGAINAVDSFHRTLPLRGNHSMRCSILEDRVALWWMKGTHIRLSALAAEILVSKRRIKWSNLRLVRHYDWNDFEGPGEPITGAGASMLSSVGGVVKGVGSTPFRWRASIKKKEQQRKQAEETRRSVEAKRKEASLKTGHGMGESVHQSDNTARSSVTKVNDTNSSSRAASLPNANLMDGALKEELKKDKSIVLGGAGGPSDMIGGLVQELGSPQVDDHVEGDENIMRSLARGTAVGLTKSGKALLDAPMDLSLSLAQGFHNAPRLWGDETVRTPIRVTGMKSGLRAARKEFAFGVYDGWTGLVKQPYHGAQREGVSGFAKGVGKGVGGWILKDIAAVFGLPAYTLKGLQKELHKGSQPTNFIRRAHIIEGQKELAALSKADFRETVETVCKSWRTIAALQAERQAAEKSGLKGRIAMYRERQKWKEYGVFENVELVNRARQARREGKDFAVEFRQHRAELAAAAVSSPRKSTASAREGSKKKKAAGDSRRASKDLQRKNVPSTVGGGGGDDGKERKSSELAGVQSGTEAVDQAEVAEHGEVGDNKNPTTATTADESAEKKAPAAHAAPPTATAHTADLKHSISV